VADAALDEVPIPAESSRAMPYDVPVHQSTKVELIVERTFRETRTEKNFQKGATFFRAGAFVALTIGFLFRTGNGPQGPRSILWM
jgi:hypothetical protein